MDNENKDFEQESRNMEPDAEVVEEFDPTLSDEFYNNLEAAIQDDQEVTSDDIPELMLGDELFAIDETEETSRTPELSADSAMEEALFAGVDAALSEQIEQEFGREEEISSTEEKEPNKFVAGWKAIPTWTKVLVSAILVILISVGLLFGTAGGRKLIYKFIVGIALGWTEDDHEDFGDLTPVPGDITISVTPEPTENPDITPEPTENPDITPEPTEDPNQNPDITREPVATPEPTATPVPEMIIMDDEDIINVLLIGEENMKGALYGRSDAMILVSVNLNGGPLKMVSFQRDMYVSIPGYSDNKLNAAYSRGGAKLLIPTIEQNFGIDIDSYVKVDFTGFENIIDTLGGLELSLTARESEYLNTTLYISKPEERNTVAGKQLMTGAQVLGYCRVRKIETADGIADDFGRNYRQRTVLKAIFDQYKNKSFAELLTIMRQCGSYVKTPENLEALAADCLEAVVEKKMFEIETLQIPKAGLYNDPTINGMDVIVFSPKNVELLQDFLYGED